MQNLKMHLEYYFVYRSIISLSYVFLEVNKHIFLFSMLFWSQIIFCPVYLFQLLCIFWCSPFVSIGRTGFTEYIYCLFVSIIKVFFIAYIFKYFFWHCVNTRTRRGITCKKIHCYMHDSGCRWRIFKKLKYFEVSVKFFEFSRVWEIYSLNWSKQINFHESPNHMSLLI